MAKPPELDLERIRRWAAEQWPERFHHEVYWEIHSRGASVTVCETRVLWAGQEEWAHQPIAQLRYRAASHDWALHWSDSNDRWHPYEPTGIQLTGTAADLLAEIDDDPTCIFKG